MSDLRERLIVALDVGSAAAARKMVGELGESVSTYKVGMQLFTAEGPQLVRDLVSSGKQVFLDLKYHDIPNTVASAVAEAARLGVTMLTVHASGGTKMLSAASEAARKVNPRLVVLAVSVLTSFSEEDLAPIGVGAALQEQVVRLSEMALQAGCGGVVASAREAPVLRRRLGESFALVTPGVRPTGAGHQDQARVVTPAEAVAAGASHIVVGRPITGAADPVREAQDILQQMAETASSRSVVPG